MYIVGVVIVLSAVMYFIAQMYTMYAHFTTPARVDRIGISFVTELAKEIRQGGSIDQSASAFNVATGFITINARAGSDAVTKYFGLESGRIVYEEDGTPVFLTPDDVSVSALRFTQIATPVSYAVRYEVSITYPTRDGEQTRTYTGLAILRHSYE